MPLSSVSSSKRAKRACPFSSAYSPRHQPCRALRSARLSLCAAPASRHRKSLCPRYGPRSSDESVSDARTTSRRPPPSKPPGRPQSRMRPMSRQQQFRRTEISSFSSCVDSLYVVHWRGGQWLRDRFEFQHRAVRHVGGQVDESSWALAHVTDPLVQFGEHRLAPRFETLAIELDARELGADERTGDEVALPQRELVARVEDDAGNGDGRLVVRDRLYHAFHECRRLNRRRRQPRLLAVRIARV